MLSPFLTWGDVKKMHKSTRDRDSPTPFGYLFTSDIREKAKVRHDEEFYFDLPPEMVAYGRLEGWPCEPKEGDSLHHEVVINAQGIVAALTLTVGEKRRYYRQDKEWIYIGPGDPARRDPSDEIYDVVETFVEVFDQTPSDQPQPVSLIWPHAPNLHEQYLQRNLLGYHIYEHDDRAAYLLVQPYAPEEEESLNITLFLITARAWLRRHQGRWTEVLDDQIVGEEGEFFGALIVPQLSTEAVDWWDSSSQPPELDMALEFCAAFPVFCFDLDHENEVSGVLLETENATWEFNRSKWIRRARTSAKHLERKVATERFLEEVLRDASSAGMPGNQPLAVSSYIERSIRLGLVVTIHPALTAETMAWFSDCGGDSVPKSLITARSFIYAYSSCYLEVHSDQITELVLVVGDTTWKRNRFRWVPVPSIRSDDEADRTEHIAVQASRVTEVMAWWDRASVGTPPDLSSIPVNMDCGNAVRLGSSARSPVHLVEDTVVYDGLREWEWCQENKLWSVYPVPQRDEEPDFDEKLPDWFYNAW